MDINELAAERRGLSARFNCKTKLDPKTGCIEWTAKTGREGYGRFRIGAKIHKRIGSHMKWPAG
jgi:hypothetical protein